MLYNQTTHKSTRQPKITEITNINGFRQRRGVQAVSVVGYSECGVIHVLPVLLIFKYDISPLKQIYGRIVRKNKSNLS